MTSMADPWFIRQFDGTARFAVDSPYTAVSNEPNASWRPFSQASLWNTPIPANPVVDPNSSAIVSWLNSLLPTFGPTDRYCGFAGQVEDYDHPIYYAKRSDPIKRVVVAPGQRDPSTTPNKLKITSMHNRLIPVPANSPETKGTDRHLTIIVGDSAYEMWGARRVNMGADKISMSWGAVTSLTGDGHTEDRCGPTASGCPLVAGIIRLSELQSGHINHALAVTVRYVRYNDFVEPASGTATPDPGVSPGDSNDLSRPKTGARLQLNMTNSEIEALSMPAWKTTILKAMAEYGMIIVDTGGTSTSYTLLLESGAPDVALGLEDRWKVFGRSQGWAATGMGYIMPLSSGVDWSKLRIVAV